MNIRTQLRAGKLAANHNQAFHVRSGLKAGGTSYQHNEALRVRTTIKAGGLRLNHNETLVRATGRPAVSMRREVVTTSREDDRLELLVVRAGLRAGKRFARARVRD
jgi:hypothetical protein